MLQASAQRNPFYTYGRPGTYSVSLTVTDGEGCDQHQTRDGGPQGPGGDLALLRGR